MHTPPHLHKGREGEGIHNPPHLQEGGGFTPPFFPEGRVSHPTPPSYRKGDTHPTSRLQEGGGFTLHPTRSAAGAARGPSLSHPSAGRRRATRHVRLRRHRGSASHCSPAMWLHARADAVCAGCAAGAANGMECGSLLLGGVGCESPSCLKGVGRESPILLEGVGCEFPSFLKEVVRCKSHSFLKKLGVDPSPLGRWSGA